MQKPTTTVVETPVKKQDRNKSNKGRPQRKERQTENWQLTESQLRAVQKPEKLNFLNSSRTRLRVQ